MSSLDNVSAVVCGMNASFSVEQCLQSLRRSGISEIIFVDGNSSDNTAEIAKKYADILVYDEGTGLADARNLGISKASKKYILNFGVDNLITKDSLIRSLNFFEENNFFGIGFSTILSDRGNYLAKCMHTYKIARYYEGERDTIGTPNIFLRETLLAHPYSSKNTHSDDAELCRRLRLSFNARFYLMNSSVEEIGQDSLSDVFKRWKNYGKSDYENWCDLSQSRDFIDNLQSLLYPLSNELIKPMTRMSCKDKIILLPFLIMITSIRYFSWFKNAIRRT